MSLGDHELERLIEPLRAERAEDQQRLFHYETAIENYAKAVQNYRIANYGLWLLVIAQWVLIAGLWARIWLG